MSEIWFTSDNHFGHRNVIPYCKRPFASVEEMDEEMVRRWNEVVKPGDVVYHLGDFSLANKTLIAEYRKRLRGRITLIRGNHDRSLAQMRDAGFEEVYNYYECRIDGLNVFMRHIPARDEGSERTYKSEFLTPPRWLPTLDIWVCGHVHEQWKTRGREVNVGVDVRDFRPACWDEIRPR